MLSQTQESLVGASPHRRRHDRELSVSRPKLGERDLAIGEQKSRYRLGRSSRELVGVERSMLDVAIAGRGARRVLSLSGQLDLDSASQLDRALEAVCADGVREVVLNLQKVDFIDTTGLGTILSGRTLCKQHRCRYFIDTPVPASFKRLLDVTGIQPYLPFKRRLGTRAPMT